FTHYIRWIIRNLWYIMFLWNRWYAWDLLDLLWLLIGYVWLGAFRDSTIPRVFLIVNMFEGWNQIVPHAQLEQSLLEVAQGTQACSSEYACANGVATTGTQSAGKIQ
ncbi:hypothetical protein ACJX0J_016528, partial [Zea mays]